MKPNIIPGSILQLGKFQAQEIQSPGHVFFWIVFLLRLKRKECYLFLIEAFKI